MSIISACIVWIWVGGTSLSQQPFSLLSVTLQAAVGHGPPGSSDQELRALWMMEHRGKGQGKRGGGGRGRGEGRTGGWLIGWQSRSRDCSLHGLSKDNHTASLRCRWRLCSLLPLDNVNWGSRPVMTTWSRGHCGTFYVFYKSVYIYNYIFIGLLKVKRTVSVLLLPKYLREFLKDAERELD